MREVVASAPGKVNLTLRVGPAAADGYHPLISVFEALNLRETVTVRTAKGAGIRVKTTAYTADGCIDHRTTSLMADLPPDGNLAVKAAKLLQKLAMTSQWGATAAGLTIDIDKRVPVAGGMAGGSADAAATLVACNELWGLGLSDDQLHQLGRSLGADVPACLSGGIALGRGRGDTMTLLVDPANAKASVPTHHWVIALAHAGLSTPEVFRTLDAAGGPHGGWALTEHTESEIRALTGNSPTELSAVLMNDLTDAALRIMPELRATMDAAKKAGALAVQLCGSGPSIALLAADAQHARDLADALVKEPHVAQAVVASGPAEGARIDEVKED
ncbi:4-(cytidine 5'-diphospho)-2-C-methyl-D-erythritol kinase [Schaalia sp. ZJ405]|uniref:4-(cytidine 5'-diphospho)-2-C-methyl-D-erythritol kinase n=1 Tax=Schaalia sp. ZJ405 TaxID=2709403 RepID=UPI0013EA4BB6|nr:4-(cytidine 5'-diphospho)-2-C-methyl-D-erythritol kinase [Schaalia sp. ZJ405]QPK81658.1 4-(cytidine 5'-diphospho)-2-C-methyl-D-erythritol kinase [Schaalia sp. ZJ405]